MSEKPHKGRIADWRKSPAFSDNGLGYVIEGVFLDHPDRLMNFDPGGHGHTSVVLVHDEATGEIETKNSRYTLTMTDRTAPAKEASAARSEPLVTDESLDAFARDYETRFRLEGFPRLREIVAAGREEMALRSSARFHTAQNIATSIRSLKSPPTVG